MWSYLIVTCLIVLSALFSGLTLALLGLSKTALEHKAKTGNKDAARVYQVRKNGNLLLCTLLLGNTATNAALSIFLGSIAGGFLAGFIATGLIVIFGEILPQAAFSRHALIVGSRTAWLVRGFLALFYVIAKPLSWMLDKVLGEEIPNILSKEELKMLIELHEDSPDSEVTRDEERITLGVLSFSEKMVSDVLTPRTVVFALEEQSDLDFQTMEEIRRRGFTRIPVFQEDIDHIIGILYSKDLIGVQPGEKLSKYYKRNDLHMIPATKKLNDLLNELVTSKKHMAFVVDEWGGLEGIVTLEDVIEEILQVEIVDESDSIVDLQADARKHVDRLLRNSFTKRLVQKKATLESKAVVRALSGSANSR